MATQAEIAEEYRRRQAVLRAVVVEQTLALWRHLFDPAKARGSWPAVRTAFAAVIRGRARASAAEAARYYVRARGDAVTRRVLTTPGVRLPDGFVPKLVEPASVETVGRRLDATGLGSFLHGVKTGRPPDVAARNAGVRVAGAASKTVLDAGRDTILEAVDTDLVAIGWARVTDADPCAWCAMLASRGPVYKTERTAGFLAHDHCACVAAAAFNPDEVWLGNARALQEEWRQVTAGVSGDEALRVWRRHWDTKRKARGEARGLQDGPAA